MKEFIIDKNVDVVPGNAEYPKYFFDDLRASRQVRIVVGGTNYKSEVRGKAALQEIVSQMLSAGKVRRVSDADVDEFEELLKARIDDVLGGCPKECDDPHIFALAKVSGCLNIISKERRMAACRDKIRSRVGHDCCPNLRVIRTEHAYRDV